MESQVTGEASNGVLRYEIMLSLARTKFEPAAVASSPSGSNAAPSSEKLPHIVTNFMLDSDGKSETPMTMRQIIISINSKTDGWPRRVGNTLFVHDESGVHWLENTAALFGWLAAKTGIVEWSDAIGCVTKGELFQELMRTVRSYIAVEELPHFPPLPGHYYACEDVEVGDDEALTELVDKFAPATEHDRMLILAMFSTPFWGGKAGSRPAFLITSDSGRGVGKSKITDMLSLLTGGHIELSAGEEASRMRSRLLSPEGLKKRLARLDNVKSLKFSWAELESIITSPLISGHRLHQGEAGRPNNLTWLITLNGASLSTDMAQRVIIIKVRRPQRIGCWESDVIELIETRRTEIIAGIRSFLESEPQPIPSHSRWASWEDQVLARLSDPWDIQKLVLERSDSANVEFQEIEIIEEFFRERLEDLGYNDFHQVHIPSKTAGHWFNEATGAKREIVAACKMLTQYCTEGNTARLSVNPSKKYGRGYFFTGENFSEPATAKYDLPEKIKQKRDDDGKKENRYWDR